MTKQETFDTVVAHLRKQGAQAMAPYIKEDGTMGEMCVYLAPNGMKCAAGCLIPDDRYKESFEKTRVGGSTAVGRLMAELGHDVGLVSELQGVHDAHPSECWETRFSEIARDHDLVYSPVNGGTV